MTKNSQRLALSRYEGWIDPMIDDNGRGSRGFPPGSDVGIYGYPDGPTPKTLPDYTNSDEVDRVLNSLTNDQRLSWLCKMFDRFGSLETLVKSTPEEKVEEILKSLGLWEY